MRQHSVRLKLWCLAIFAGLLLTHGLVAHAQQLIPPTGGFPPGALGNVKKEDAALQLSAAGNLFARYFKENLRFLLERGAEAAAVGADFALGVPLKLFVVVAQFALLVIGYVTGFFLRFLGNTVDFILGVSNFATNEWVQAGWTFTRDALNFFFILALLVIAFATVAGIEGYGMKRLLPRLLIAALLVNFSLAISGALVGFSRAAMHALSGATPGSAPGTTLSTRLANSTLVNNFFIYTPETLFAPVRPTNLDNWTAIRATEQAKALLTASIATIMLIIVTVAIGAVALTLVIRVVALYVLLILSPVGFVFSVLPQTAGYAKQWWDTFVTYLLYGPVVVFFLSLAARIGVAGDERGIKALTGQLGIPTGSAASNSFLQKGNEMLGDMFEAMFVVLFIIIGLMAASKMGVAGAAIATSAAGLIQRFGTAPGRFAWARTGAPIAAGFKEAQEARAQARGAGALGQLGARFGAPFQSEVRDRMKRRAEEERMKTFGTSGAGIEEVKKALAGGDVAAARYAVKSKLHEEMEPEDLASALKVLAGASRTTSSEFLTLSNRLKEKLPAEGEKIVSEAKGVPFDESKVQINLNKLDPGKSVAAYAKDNRLKTMLQQGTVSLTENLVRGVAQGSGRDELEKLARASKKKSAGAEFRLGQAGIGPGPQPGSE